MMDRRYRAIVRLLRKGSISASEAADALGRHRSYIYRVVEREGIDLVRARADFVRRSVGDLR